jgi:hypothetical protein
MKDFSKEINEWRAFLEESRTRDAVIISDSLIQSRKEILKATDLESNPEFIYFIINDEFRDFIIKETSPESIMKKYIERIAELEALIEKSKTEINEMKNLIEKSNTKEIGSENEA